MYNGNASSRREAKPLLAGSSVKSGGPSLTLDGLPTHDSINFLPTLSPELNPWCLGKTIKIPVADFYFNPREVTHAGKKMRVADYGLFLGMIKDWVKGDRYRGGITKEEALDFAFSAGAR